MTPHEFFSTYHIPPDEIRANRPAFHYFCEYCAADRARRSVVLAMAYNTLGKKGIVQIAKWLQKESGPLLAAARKNVKGVRK